MLSRTRTRAMGGALAALLAASSLTLVGPAHAATTDPNPSERELAHAELAIQAAEEGMVLLENNDDALPLPETGNIALFGLGAARTVKGGTGSGDVNNRYTVNVRAGLEARGYTITTNASYWSAVSGASSDPTLTSSTVQPTSPTDTAVYVLARNSGEGVDRTHSKGDYLLTDIESANIVRIGQTYSRVVVVLNVGGVVDTSFFKTINAGGTDPAGGARLDALVHMSQGGQESGTALANLLSGAAVPSGKLTDTWAAQYSYYPASATFARNDGNSFTEDYTEGIYVGYRYFDSFYRTINPLAPQDVVNYPFGFGLSYTDFEVEPQSVQADMSTVTVKAKVTNTGDTYSGKEVVEVYFSAPQSGLDKPYQELAGYAKTDVLAPGESQVLTIRFVTTDMASYDMATAAYVMDAGQYLIRVGNSSRNTQVAAKIDLAATTVTEQLATEFDDQEPSSELESSPADFYSYPTEAAEIAAAPALTLSTAGFVAPDNASGLQQDVLVEPSSPYFGLDGELLGATTALVDPAETDWEETGAPYSPKDGETVTAVTPVPGATLFDVAKGTVTMDEFVAGLSVYELASIVEGTNVRGSTTSAVGTAGYTTPTLESLGVPALSLADGPAGLRLTREITTTTPTTYQFATAWPIGTLLAQTWNPELVEAVGAAVGLEMSEFGVAMWLAPALNIHRDPLNGRNFEYYSEDPVVSGIIATAMTLGVQSEPGLGVTIKHFAANGQESDRQRSNSIVSERALREIYLEGFKRVVQSAQPMAFMTSYNKINGISASASYDLNIDVLRGEWGYDGVVMTDWGANYYTRDTLYSGNDLIMPGAGPAEVVGVVMESEPTWDLAGLPVYRKASRNSVGNPIGVHQWSWGTFVPSPGGSVVYTHTIDETTDLTQTPASGTYTGVNINFQCPATCTFTPLPAWNDVNSAYNWLMEQLDPNAPVDPIWIKALTAEQKSAINVQINRTDAQMAVESYTITIRGEQGPLRLGDLQRSAEKTLKVASRSAAFEELAQLQSVPGITVLPYGDYFDDLLPYFDVTRDPVQEPVPPAVNAVTVHPATVSVTTGTTQQFTATVDRVGGASAEVTWTVAGAAAAGTTISASGLLTVSADETATGLTIAATSVADPGKSGSATVTVTTPPVFGFPDVPESSIFYDEIIWAAENGITNGYADGTFRPAAPIARDAVAAMLFRTLNPGAAKPACAAGAEPFTDVPSTHPFCGEIAWLKAEGITSGYADGTYRPATSIARDAMAAFIARVYGPSELPSCGSVRPFTDVAVGHQFCKEIRWLKRERISSGFDDGSYRPAQSIERQAFVAFLSRAER